MNFISRIIVSSIDSLAKVAIYLDKPIKEWLYNTIETLQAIDIVSNGN